MKYALIASLLAFATVECKPAAHVEIVDDLRVVPRGWREVGAPAQSQKMKFRIAVRSSDNTLLERTLMEVSTPSHPRYGQHLKRDELKELIKPRAESTNTVLNWLERSGVEARDIENNGEWINFHAPVERAESMMGTIFKTYQSEARPGVKRVRSLNYSVPKEVRNHIDMIQPTTRFDHIKASRGLVSKRQEAPSNNAGFNVTACNTTMTPACISNLYNFADYKIDPKGNFTMGAAGFLEQYASFADFNKFTQLYAPNAVNSTFTWTSVNGGLLDQNSTLSRSGANIDMQYTTAFVAPIIKTNFYSTAGRGLLIPDLDWPTQNDIMNEPFLEFFTYLVNLPDDELPIVLTTSYGETEQSVPATYATAVCNLIGQLGVRGVSVIFASGDSGVGSSCQTNDGKNTTRFQPMFPASCPYVTSVGATAYTGPEQAAFFSSGGFSDLWPRPSYQDVMVPAYLKKLGNQWKGLYNPAGRGFPDVSAQCRRFSFVENGEVVMQSGTSMSTPVFASVIALLNNARLASCKPALGFLNPWIYEQGYKGLNDIVTGGSNGCTGRTIYSNVTAPIVPFASWNATEGWDPVTGLGTPDFKKLLELS